MIQTILKYQDIEKDLRKIEYEIQSSDERKKAQKAKLFLIESEENVGKMDRRAQELLQLFSKAKKAYEDNAATIREYDSIAKTLKSGDEAAYLAKKIGQVLETLKNIEKELAVITRDMDDVAKAFSELKSKYNAAVKEYTENKELYEKLKESKAGEINAIKEKMNALAKKIDPVILEKYNKKRVDKIFPVLVPLRDNMCGGCSMEISLKEMDKLRTQKIIECENCHRLIYTV
jgi:predicted  nucleic acid-binding Zn-ribbon protein